MATVVQFPRRRAPQAILEEIVAVKLRLVGFYAVLEDLTDDEEAAWQDLEARLDVLKAEVERTLVATTGQTSAAWLEALS